MATAASQAMRISAIDHTRRALYYAIMQRIEQYAETRSLHSFDQKDLAGELVELFMQGNGAILQELDIYRNAAAEMRLAEMMLRPPPPIFIPAKEAEMPDLEALLQAAREYRALNPMTEEERSAQVRSFAYGNVSMHNPDVTREMVDEEARKLGL